MAIKRLTQPANEPVTIEDVKAQCRVLDSSEDAYLFGLIAVAREYVEKEIGRTLIRSDSQMILHCFPCGAIELPEPISEIIGIDYKDPSNTAQTIAPAALEFEEGALTPKLRTVDGASWPATANRLNAVKISYRAGYGDDLNAVPAQIKQAILLVVGHLFANREQTTASALVEIPIGVPALLARYTIKRLG